MTAPFSIETLAPTHARARFSSSSEPLDRYFREQVGQDVRRRVAACYVAIDRATDRVAGYYTLSASSIPLAEIPKSLAKRLPKYNAVPVARLGRLAVDLDYRGQGLGAALLWDAILRAAKSEVALFALVVDAKTREAAAFYRHHGFIAFGSRPEQLVLALWNRPDHPG